MNNKTAEAMRNDCARKFLLAEGKKTIMGFAARWLWLPPFLARMVVGIFFIQTGLSQLRDIDGSKDILSFFGAPFISNNVGFHLFLPLSLSAGRSCCWEA